METIIGQGDGPRGEQGGVNTPAGDLIKDTDMAGFTEDVIRASMEVPVLVDFWAPWCGPCKQLGPLLEKVVTAAAGKVKLVKVNIDENQPIAQQLRIQSIPAVFAFQNGQPVDGFVGVLPESQIRTFIERLAGGAIGPTPVEAALAAGKEALDDGDAQGAAAAFGVVLEADPENAAALAGLTRCHLQLDQIDEARAVLDRLPAQPGEQADIAGARAALALAEEAAEAADSGEIGELRQRLEANPKDHETRFDLATALNAAGQREAAADALLEIAQLDRNWNDQAARKQLLKLFDAWGPTDPLTVETRRRLSSILFS